MYIWIAVIVLGVVADIMSSLMIFIWFSLGALVATVANILGASMGVQVILFFAVSVLGIVIGYPMARKMIKKSVKQKDTMENSYIGEVFVAENDIKDSGQLKVNGIYWTVINTGDIIRKNEKLKVTGIKGTKLMVTKFNENINKQEG